MKIKRKIPLMLTLEQLEKLDTKRLLSYKRRINGYAYRAPEEGFFDCGCSECSSIRESRKPWKEILENIKNILSMREHVDKIFKKEVKI